MTMTTSPSGRKFIRVRESFEALPYLDGGGVPTIGFGSTYYENGTRVTMKDRAITVEQAERIFADTLKKYEYTVNKSIKHTLSQHQFDALVSLCYNIGQSAFAGSTLVKILNAGAFDTEVAKQITRWDKDNGRKVAGLTTRRALECKIYLDNNYVY
jgi:lysozyme